MDKQSLDQILFELESLLQDQRATKVRGLVLDQAMVQSLARNDEWELAKALVRRQLCLRRLKDKYLLSKIKDQSLPDGIGVFTPEFVTQKTKSSNKPGKARIAAKILADLAQAGSPAVFDLRTIYQVFNWNKLPKKFELRLEQYPYSNFFIQEQLVLIDFNQIHYQSITNYNPGHRGALDLEDIALIVQQLMNDSQISNGKSLHINKELFQLLNPALDLRRLLPLLAKMGLSLFYSEHYLLVCQTSKLYHVDYRQLRQATNRRK